MPWFAIHTGLSLLMAWVYVSVGRVVAKRHVSEAAQPAQRAFIAWWWLLGAVTLAGPILSLAGRYEQPDLAGYLVALYALLAIILYAVGALLYYLVYIYTGRTRAWRPILAGYLGLFFLFHYYIVLADPVGLNYGDGSTEIIWENDLEGSVFGRVVGLLLVGPPLIAAALYSSLYFRADNRSQRFRILAVGGGFFLWFGSSLLAGQVVEVTDRVWWPVVADVIALGASLLVMAAFQPPAWLARCLGLQGYAAPADATPLHDEAK